MAQLTHPESIPAMACHTLPASLSSFCRTWSGINSAPSTISASPNSAPASRADGWNALPLPGTLYPSHVGRTVSISGCTRSHPYSIAIRHTQRQVLMADSAWNRRFSYSPPPGSHHTEVKLTREIAIIDARTAADQSVNRGSRSSVDSEQMRVKPLHCVRIF